MAKFYALAQTKNNKSVVVSLEETVYHKAWDEARDIAKKGDFKLEDVRVYQNGRNQPQTLSKGNVLREGNHKPKTKNKK